eukprot:10526561-Ditylum_brightwellii.AAC.1
MADEMKLKHGIMWSTQSLESVGLAGDLIDLKKIIKKIISADDDDVPEPTQYVCQWRYKNVVTKDTFNCELFFNNGSLSGDSLLKQFDQMTLSYEVVGSR